MKALIVETDEETRQVLMTTLKKRGHRSVAFDTCQAALEHYREEFYPLILIDLGIAGRYGVEFCEKIRNLPYGQYSVIMAIVENDDSDKLLIASGAEYSLPLSFTDELLNARLQVAEKYMHNIARRWDEENRLLFCLNFSEIITRTALGFISASASQFGEILKQSLRQIGEFLEVEHGYLYLCDSERTGDFKLFCEWIAVGAERELGDKSMREAYALQCFRKKIQRREICAFGNVDELPEGSAEERSFFIERGILSLINIPIQHEGALLGLVGFDSLREEKRWTEDAVKFFKIFAEICGKALKQKTALLKAQKERGNLEKQLAESEHLLSRTNEDLLAEIEYHKKADAELESFRHNLQERVDQRNAELIETNAKLEEEISERKQLAAHLEEARRAAEAANRAKSEFLANMSHELRTPLNGILGYTQILKRDPELSGRQKAQVDIMQRSGEHLLTLIEDVLDLSKIEAGKMELHPTEFQLRKLLQDIADVMRIRAQQKSIDFYFDAHNKLPHTIKMDDKRLRQIILNLIGNAVKFTDRGSVDFIVRPTRNGKVRFLIRDTGPGIPPEKLEQLFVAFQQVHDPSSHTEGTGLGLTISQKLANAMGSKIELESHLGKGSRFWFDLALEEVAGAQETNRVVEPLIAGFRGDKKKIMVVDDTWENRSIITNLLSPLGFQIYEAKDGKEALERGIQVCPDLFLIDLIMPVMNGFETARAIRQAPELSHSIVIATSSSVFEHTRIDSLSAGCQAFLPRPIRAEELFKILHEYLGIQWVYHGIEHKQPHPLPSPGSNSRLSGAWPEPKDILALTSFSRDGDIECILEKAEEMEHKNSALEPLAQEIRRLARGFELDKLDELIQSYAKEENAVNSPA